MAENVDRIDFRTAVSDIISYQNGNYISLILFFFLSFFIIYLTIKSFVTDFDFFFFENSLSLPPCLKLNLPDTYAKRKSYRCYISQTRKNHYYIISLRFGALFPIWNSRPCPYKWFCSVYGTPASWGLTTISICFLKLRSGSKWTLRLCEVFTGENAEALISCWHLSSK